MALALTKLTNQVIESAESVAAASIEWASDTGGTVLNAGAGEWFQMVTIQVSVTFHASATGNCYLHLRKSSDDGTTEDTGGTSTYAMTIPVTAGATIVKSIDVYDFDYLDVGLQNLDAAQVATWTAIYSGVKITGLD